MWEWFLPAGERDKYRFEVMEGGGMGGGGQPMTWGATIGLWSFVVVAIAAFFFMIWLGS